MFYTLTVCPCCQETDVEPDYELELDADQHVVAECYQCEYGDQLEYNLTDHQSHVLLFNEGSIPF